MALFGLNWEESKWLWQFCYIVLYFFASKIGVKSHSKKKVPWHRCWPALASGSNCHFSQKNAFFEQKKAFFQKVHFIQKCSVAQNTVFQFVKKIFFLSNPKLIFFTKFNLNILLNDKAGKRQKKLSTWRRPFTVIVKLQTSRRFVSSSTHHPPPIMWGDTGRSNVTIIPGMLPVMGHSSQSVARDDHLPLQIKRWRHEIIPNKIPFKFLQFCLGCLLPPTITR